MSKRPLSLIVAARITVAVFLAVLSLGRIENLARADDGKGREDAARLSDGDRQRFEEGGPVVVKHFVASLRYAERLGELHTLIDPRYLKKHRRLEGKLSFQKFVTKSIYELKLSDDPQTVLCTASTEESVRETFLFRTTIYENRVYLLPLDPPDPATGIYKPWILRIKQIPSDEDVQEAAGWRVAFANGVTQVCQVREDGTASVVEPRRTSVGKATVAGNSIVIVYEDDRTERWTPVGNRRVVEHWFPGSQFPTATPVLGIAERVQ